MHVQKDSGSYSSGSSSLGNSKFPSVNPEKSVLEPPENEISQKLGMKLFEFMPNYLSPHELKAFKCLDHFWNNMSIIWLKSEEIFCSFEKATEIENRARNILRWFKAAESGDLEAIKTLIKEDPSLLNITCEENNNACHIAAKNGHVAIVDFFQTNSDLMRQFNANGHTPIHLAIHDNQVNIIAHMFQDEHLMMMSCTAQGTNELQLAALCGHDEIFEMIYNYEPLLIHSKLGASPHDNMLQLAISGKNNLAIDLIIKKHPLQITERNALGDYPIHTAIQFGDLELVKLLEKKNPSLIEMDPYHETTLHVACSPKASFEVFKYIYDKFPLKRKLENKEGRQPIHFAITSNRFDIVKLYIDNHPRILEEKTKQGQNCLHFIETLEMAKYIYESEKSLLSDNSTLSPLHLASHKAEFETVQFYLSCKEGNCFTKDMMGNNILHCAIHGTPPNRQKPGYQEDQVKLVKYLMAEYPQLLDEKDREGKQPFHYAMNVFGKEMINEMIAAQLKYRKSLQTCKPPSQNAPSSEAKKTAKWFYTIAHDDLNTIQTQSKDDPSLLNIKDANGFNSAHIAVMQASLPIVTFLYGNPQLFLEYNNLGNTPFHTAIIQGKVEIVKYLCTKSDVYINRRCKQHGYTPLQIAAANGQHEIFEILEKIASKEQIYAQHNHGNMLHIAIQGRNSSLIANIIRNHPKLISELDQSGIYPIHAAIRAGKLDSVILLDKKCPILIRESIPEGTALHLACKKDGDIKIVEYILKYKKNHGMNKIPDGKKCTPFHLAVANGRLDFVKCLLRIDKTLINTTAENESNALHLAKDLETAKYLHKIEPKLLFGLCESGYNPIQAKAQIGDFEMTKLYLSFENAPYKAKTHDGDNLLHLAVKANTVSSRDGAKESQKQLVLFLVDNYPEFLSQKNNAGHQPHERAVGHLAIDTVGYMMDTLIKHITKKIEVKTLESPRHGLNIPSEKTKATNLEQNIATIAETKPLVIIGENNEQVIPFSLLQPEILSAAPQPSLNTEIKEKEGKRLQPSSFDKGSTNVMPAPKEPKKTHVLKTLASKVSKWSNTVGMSKEERELRNEEKAKRWFKRKLEGIDPTASMSQSECSRSVLSEASEVEASIAEEGFQKLIDARVADSSGKSNKDIIFGVLNELKEAKIIKVGTGKNNKIHATYICGSSKPPSLTIHMHNHDKPWHEQFRVIKHFVLFIAACGIDTTEIEKELHYNSVQASKNNTNDVAQDAGKG